MNVSTSVLCASSGRSKRYRAGIVERSPTVIFLVHTVRMSGMMNNASCQL